MTAGRPAPREPGEQGQTLVVIGARGDLTARLLLPGLGGLVAASGLTDLLLVGSDRGQWSDEEWRALVARAFADGDASGPAVDTVVRNARYVAADATDDDGLHRLLACRKGRLTLYFPLPPAVTVEACRALARTGLPPGTRLVLEKPFGTDAAGATALNELLHRLVPEDHVHRVDHFLGMSTVLNLLGVRFANRVFEPLLTAEHVEAVDIVFDETLGLEGRAGFYDVTGALRDMIQSHLLQVLALVAMLPPSTLDQLDVRDAKAQVLRATRVWDDRPGRFSRRARYTAGTVDGRALPSYADEAGIDPARGTETLAEVVFAVDTWRWAGVPFRVRSGKAIGAPRQEVTYWFKAPQHVPRGLLGEAVGNRLRIGLGPRRLQLEININGPGDPSTVSPVTLDTSFGTGDLLEYGEVLRGVLEDEQPLSVRDDMSVESWRIVEPVLDAWREARVPLDEYRAGSAGPRGWEDLVARRNGEGTAPV
ncbi:glucose-6-phosphate dehydrogenase [Streptomyces naganishii]|uniref:Glucose-6-phosphate 1-dehydrogenase n=1 Tax=Streptomyces naganishii JCM 4654 TaxID=1306179 RepID=A0A918Y8Q4_9ACTN|nr:glucose-6-phosphate dehydrogenase [Streptomyces naganishii]GHD93100.1 glucose-6-phosphate 1-dehydrogenase [Streptomyces naganishii JCM 4654]